VLVEIYSDVVCPWCFIGKRRFESALSRFGGRDEVEVVWRPFQLDPTAPREPVPVTRAYERKFGGPEQATRIIDHVTEVAAADGIEFHLDKGLRANTFDAHRLIEWARLQGMQSAMGERLFEAYFAEGLDVADHATLAALAGEAGLNAGEAAAFLASDEGVEELRSELGHALELGITSVPTFVFEGAWAVPGAHDPDTMLRVLERVAARREQLTQARAGDREDGEGKGDACEGDACAT
jgi:predicted DsbA family dithiol-disulfide isomerase